MIGLKAGRRVLNLVWPAFEERDGAIFLAGQQLVQMKQFPTRTAAEAFYNHRHILDEFRHSIPWGPDPEYPEASAPDWSHPEYKLACELAQTIAQMWLRKLEADFPGDQFRVYVTTKNDPIVRFHRVYDGEPVWGTNEEAAAQIASGEVSIYASQAGSRMAAV